MPQEEVVRLAPKTDVLRQLYLYSGNECAMTGCRASMIDENGKWIGIVCHIEAAMPKGERFNEHMTNEQRREVSNLILLCHPHHVATDDVDEWDVDKMRKLKEDHERRFRGGIDGLFQEVSDWTQSSVVTPASSLDAFNESQGWVVTEDVEREGNVAEIAKFAEDIRRTPKPARQLLKIIVTEGERMRGSHKDDLVMTVQELMDRTGLSPGEIASRAEQLDKYKLAYLEADKNAWMFHEFSGPYVVTHDRSYPGWARLQGYCRGAGIDPSAILVDLRFDLLD